jgi:hypothetical protein
MQVELSDEISPVDLENAREVAAALCLLLSKCGSDLDAFVVEAGGAHVRLQPDRLLSLVKLIDGVASTSPQAGDERDEIPPDTAAELLGMAPPSVMRLIERGYLHARVTEGGCRLSRTEVLSYKARQAVIRREALSELVKLTQEHGF